MTDFARLAASRPVNRQANQVAASAPEDGRPWSDVTLALEEQRAVAVGEAEKLRRQLEALGYETPLTTEAEKDRRHQLARRLLHYEQVIHDLARELRQANRNRRSSGQANAATRTKLAVLGFG